MTTQVPARRSGARAWLAARSSLPLRVAAHLGAAAPLALLIYDTLNNRLSVNPIQDLTLRTGLAALVVLVLSLAVTPLNILFQFRELVPLRKVLGLWAFVYALLHLLIFAVVDYGLDWSLISGAIGEKRYVLVGFAAFLLLLPLALTSTRWAMRRLGKRWKPLHQLVYVAAALAVFHFFLLVKADVREPLVYGAILAVLLALRLPPVRRALARKRASQP